MLLSSKLKSAFGSGDRSRGAAYAKDGAVESLVVSKGILQSTVLGGYGAYSCTIDIASDRDAMHCECPRFADGYNCKHLWATILEYDAKRNSPNWRLKKKVRKTRVRTDAPAPSAKRIPAQKSTKAKKSSKAPAWQSLFGAQENGLTAIDPPDIYAEETTQTSEEFFYVIDVTSQSPTGREALDLVILQRTRKRNGNWSRLKRLPGLTLNNDSFEDPLDLDIIQRLFNTAAYYDPFEFSGMPCGDFQLPVHGDRGVVDLLERLIASERFFWSADEDFEFDALHPIQSVDATTPYAILMEVVDVPKPKHAGELRFLIEQSPYLKQPAKLVDDDEIVKLADDGSGLLQTGLIRIQNAYAIPLWRGARDFPPIKIKKSERVDFLKQLAATPGTPEVRLPDSWSVGTTEPLPKGRMKLTESQWETEFTGAIDFRYDNIRFSFEDQRTCAYDEETNTWVQRDIATEKKLIEVIEDIPYLFLPRDGADGDFGMERKDILSLVDDLGENGWEIILLGSRIKRPGEFDIAVSSGQDWFDLQAEVDFEGEAVPLPSLLQALNRKEDFITLADGSRGRIPVALIQQYAKIAEFGEVEEDGKIRFRPTQAMLLDSMLEAKEGVVLDKGFKKFRKKLKSFTGIKPKNAPAGFKGELRAYQQDGLGWLHYLRDFGFGGCLADDMGLGKTIQVLALLESRRTRKINAVPKRISPTDGVTVVPPKRLTGKKASAKHPSLKKRGKAENENKEDSPVVGSPSKLALAFRDFAAIAKRKPSIVVVPKSLIFNWIDEAAKFTPKLKILNYTGGDRKSRATKCEEFDVLITTYSTMRNDITELTELEFDYAILDESQAIKNSKALCTKASRLLRADYRLAMTGTPIENHLGELWSLFEFLNPGMLGGARNFASITASKKGEAAEEREKTLNDLSKAIQPFILRRTKEQVLTDLPAKTEQTLYCDMLPAQKKKYNELKDYYRIKLAKKVATVGLGQSKIQVLEALLRLRQVACDPRLLDKNNKPGAKIEFLQQQIGEVISEGHKVLVFSQFTTLLALVRDQFDKDGITYEYLDGKTSDRQGCVRRFQNNADIPAFLISLKAGGHGLNLTAADYVYLLDPWWNPAVEAQAIDRAHRMGQQRPVIAYRMICRDTVEEKIVELQESKRELADSIIRADESLIRSLTADDLSLLLG